MHAVVITEPGGPEVLSWAEVPDPVCGPGEVVVDVVASAVNRADLLQRMGKYDVPPGAPAWPGLECSGTISEVGEGVTGWKAGDQVCALLSGGGYAERVAVPAGQLLPVPTGVDLVTAAALPEVMCTVWSNLVMTAGLRAGEVLLVHGGASGIGTAAIQVGRALGARVAVTAGTAAKLERCAELGAEILVNYRSEDFAEVVTAATGGHGADVVLDIMGGSYLARNLDVLAMDGRITIIGTMGGRRTELDLAAVMGKRARITGSLLRRRTRAGKAAVVAEVCEHLWPLIESGTVRPVVDRTLPMTEAAEAHRVVADGEHVGKVLLTT
ncbi:NAD(P)H-quinone oxidoreductase [Jiangella alkaliphila]|uniref:Putative NAD(P)H quinone oxidoreductase, PIG3 family n=1 Tax=Jiangella alkaliphila TaxID=419479 RepID=A0A1H2HCR0_9ACTN|nr:NAD(P)H-quinone oxidoreductase [Jiangella alkaliphila]SDU29586.1 putative NAD(P)H quinone oxidoreductase, PIG3 family [Jiangella alkaliphila]